jgi:hypothetical protein
VKSSTKGMMAGNIVFGGFIGAGVDAASGAAYDYPALFQVMMGQQQTLQAPAQNQAQSQPQPPVAVAGGTQ